MASYSNMTSADLARLQEMNDVIARDLIPAMIFVALLMITGLVGNAVVCFVFTFRLPMSTQHVLIVALATFDLVSCVIAMPTEIADMRFFYTFESEFACRLLRFINSYCAFASILTLVVIAVDRFRKVCRPLNRQMSLRQTKMALVAVLLVALLFAIPAAVLYGIRTVDTSEPGILGHDCSTNDAVKDTLFPFVYNVVLFLAFVILLIALTVIYVKIWKEMKKHNLRMALNSTSRRDSLYPSEISAVTNSEIIRRGSETPSNDIKILCQHKAKAEAEKGRGTLIHHIGTLSQPKPTTDNQTDSEMMTRDIGTPFHYKDTADTVKESETPNCEKETLSHSHSNRAFGQDDEVLCSLEDVGTQDCLQSDDGFSAKESESHKVRCGSRDCCDAKEHETDLEISKLVPVKCPDSGKTDPEGRGAMAALKQDVDMGVTDNTNDAQTSNFLDAIMSLNMDELSRNSDNGVVTWHENTLYKQSVDQKSLQTQEGRGVFTKSEEGFGHDDHAQAKDLKSTSGVLNNDNDTKDNENTITKDLKNTVSVLNDDHGNKDDLKLKPIFNKSSTPTITIDTEKEQDATFSHSTLKFNVNSCSEEEDIVFNDEDSHETSKHKFDLKKALSTRSSPGAVKTHKATIIAMSVTVVFFLSFVPYLSLTTARTIHKNFDQELTGASLTLFNMFLRSYFINSVANPIIYGVLNAEFRRKCVSLFRQVCACGKQRCL